MSTLLYSPLLDHAATARKMILSPFFSGPLLLAMTAAPDAVRDVFTTLASHLPLQYLPSTSLNFADFSTAVKVLFAISVIRKINQGLNVMALNSWRMRPGTGWDWPNEIAVVTGGSSGIGQNIVEKLVAVGVRCAVLDVQELPKAMEGNSHIRFYKCDVTSSESVSAAADAVRREIGHPSILINNAGITSPMSILNMPEAFLRRIFGVNVMALWITTQQFLPRMIQLNKGHVVTVASIASFVALPTAADYSATKAGALAFHEALACELKHVYKAPNILTSVVHPNFTRTPLIAEYADRLENSGVRMLTSEEIARQTVTQLLSKRGGQLIIPDSTAVVSGIRGWPNWTQELLRDVLGRNQIYP